MEKLKTIFNTAVEFLTEKVYSPLSDIWEGFFHGDAPFEFYWVLIGLGALLLLVFLISACSPKKYLIRFHENNKKYHTVKCRFKKVIKFPKIKAPKGKVLEGWYTDKDCTVLYESVVLDRKKKLDLYAKFVDVEQEVVETVNNETEVEVPAVVDETTNEVEVPVVETVATGIEEFENVTASMSVGEIYDSIRCALLSYERVKAFAQVGVLRKQFIAEMFEKDGKIYLYLAVDPSIMLSKGYSVEKFTEREFSVVPCKKVITSDADYEEALLLIDETMSFNNLVKTGIPASKVISDEQTRKSGFAFFVKNETVATTADDYYKILRAITNCYVHSPNAKNLTDVNNKMILKIFKKGSEVSIYLALNPEKEGLQNVSYDKNFTETPAMFVVKTADDFVKATVLIDKLMFNYEMVKTPDKAELQLEEAIQKNCGFGYRIRF